MLIFNEIRSLSPQTVHIPIEPFSLAWSALFRVKI
jgi:hypothetical protein